LKGRIAALGNQTKIILSWHDFRGTPHERALRAKLREMRSIGADIIKLASNPEHLSALSFLHFPQKKHPQPCRPLMSAVR
jgi:3-dehydroquinate dehydratase type I